MLTFVLLSTGFAWKLIQNQQCADGGQLVGYGRLWDCKRACLADEECIGFQFGTHWTGSYECMGSCHLVKECTDFDDSTGDFFYMGDRPTYTHIPAVQCAADPEYCGDVEMNPIIGYWIGYLTLEDCKAECKGWEDQHGRECVAVEWQAHQDDDDCPDVALCALAWGCDYQVLWEFGDTYLMDEVAEVKVSEVEVAFAALLERYESRILELEIEEIEEEIEAMENEEEGEDEDDDGCDGLYYKKYTAKQKCMFLTFIATLVLCCTCGACCAKAGKCKHRRRHCRRHCRRTITLVVPSGTVAVAGGKTLETGNTTTTTGETAAGGETGDQQTTNNETARTSGEDGPQEEEPSKTEDSNTAPPMNEKEGPGPEDQPPAADEVEEPSILNVEATAEESIKVEPETVVKQDEAPLTLDDPEKGASTEL